MIIQYYIGLVCNQVKKNTRVKHFEVTEFKIVSCKLKAASMFNRCSRSDEIAGHEYDRQLHNHWGGKCMTWKNDEQSPKTQLFLMKNKYT